MIDLHLCVDHMYWLPSFPLKLSAFHSNWSYRCFSVAEVAPAGREEAQAASVEDVQAAAAARLPAEPSESDPGYARVAFRLPDGSRLQRRFNKTDTVQVRWGQLACIQDGIRNCERKFNACRC